jgi:hypothetical protein
MNTSGKSTTSIQFWGPGHLMSFLKDALPMIGAVLLVPHVLIAQHANANDQKEQLRFTFPAVSFSISTDCPPAVARPVPKSSNCLEQPLHTLFAAYSSGEYSLHYP